MWVIHLCSRWQAWVCAQGDWAGFQERRRKWASPPRSRLELAHCYLGSALLAKACPKPALLDSRVGSRTWACWGDPPHHTVKSMGIEKGGPLGHMSQQSDWCVVISYRRVRHMKQRMDSSLLKMINAVLA